METKQFDLRTVLTVTTGRLLTKGKGPGDNGISDLYEVLDWMTNDNLMTHQLPRASNECKPWLLRCFPELAPLESDVVEFCDASLVQDGNLTREQMAAGIDGLVWGLGERIGNHVFDVPRSPQDDHERIDPIAEFVEMRGSDDGVFVCVLDKEG